VTHLPKLRPALLLAALALLAACNKSGDANASASGEVLQGTISDDMLPLDKLTSEAPLAEPTAAASGKPGSAAAAPGAAADTAAADTGEEPGEAAPSPAASETAAPAPAE
jgi:hypothetical protein